MAYLMTLLVKRTLTMRASSVISHSTENARRSASARRLQMSSVSGFGSMSMRRCTRYVVVALDRRQSFKERQGRGTPLESTSLLAKHCVAHARRTGKHSDAAEVLLPLVAQVLVFDSGSTKRPVARLCSELVSTMSSDQTLLYFSACLSFTGAETQGASVTMDILLASWAPQQLF